MGAEPSMQIRHNCRACLLLLCLLAVLLASVASLDAATLYVWTNSPYPGLPFNDWTNAAHDVQTAIDASTDGDTVLVTNGVYDTGGAADYPPGLLQTNRVAIHRPITVRSVNGPLFTIIQGAKDPTGSYGPGYAAVRCVYMTNGAMLAGFTLTNGTTLPDGSGANGGGVWCHSTNAVISNCVFVGNVASGVGGGASFGTLNNCEFTMNWATWGGGAAANSVLNDCDCVDNAAGDGGAGYYVTMNNCTIISNSAYHGGGTYMSVLSSCTLSGNIGSDSGGGACGCTLNNCTLTDNEAGTSGGGAYGGALIQCTIVGNRAIAVDSWPSGIGGGGVACGTLELCTLVSNSAALGGATIHSDLFNCTLSGNSASGGGGGGFDGAFHNCLITGNTAGEYGGGVVDGSLFDCTLAGNSASNQCGGAYNCDLYNSIVYGNFSPSQPNHELCGVTNCCTTPMPDGPGNFTNDPQFVDAAAGNYRLKAGSPCIDTGSNELVLATMDLDGNPRIVGGVVDVGAYEFQGYWAWTMGITNGRTHFSDCATDDGYPNLLKYATASSPTICDDLARLAGGHGSGLFALFNRNTNAVDVTLVVESSDTLANDANWIGVATNVNGSWGGALNVEESGSGNPVRVVVRDPDVEGLATNCFMRLRVAKP